MTTPLYLDHAATTPVAPRVLDAMLPYFTAHYGNASSIHRAGQRARKAIDYARLQLANTVNVLPRQVVFTSGATEALNHIVHSVLSSKPGGFITAATEHAVVTALAKQWEPKRPVHVIAPEPSGEITLEALRAALTAQAANGGTALVMLMQVNNETGVITDTAAAAELAHEFGAYIAVDAVQALGVEPVRFTEHDYDFMALSAHKVYGPKGVGALVMRNDIGLTPYFVGGQQERGFRAGTVNVPAIVGFGEAAERAHDRQASERTRLQAIQQHFEHEVQNITGVHINGVGTTRSVKHSSVSVAGVDGETMLLMLDQAGLHISAGSACAAGSLEPSHVLLAMGVPPSQAKATFRFSFGDQTTMAVIDEAVQRFAAVVDEHRALLG